MVYRARLGMALLASGWLACAAPASSERGAVAQPILGGTDDTIHRNVVGIRFYTTEGIGTCTGSLILPNLVLTARHCVSRTTEGGFTCSRYVDPDGTVHETTTASDPYPAGHFGVTIANRISLDPGASGIVDVAEVWVPENSTGVSLCGKDIALLRLSTPITDVGLIEPRLDQFPEANETFAAVGYGATDGSGRGAGVRRWRSGLKVYADGPGFDEGRRLVLTASEWLGDTGTCVGDSGGPALDALGATMGVLSRGPSDCSYPVYTRVDSWADWIRTQARAALAASPATAPAWLEPPAEGATAFGEPCRGDVQCALSEVCAISGDARICTRRDCAACPSGWVCRSSGGLSACAPADAGTPDAGADAAGADAGADGGDGGGHGGCAASPRTDRSRCALSLLGVVALALLARHRRRERQSHSVSASRTIKS